MGFGLKGYILDKPRVSGANSPFTSTPDDIISDSSAFNSHYTSSETVPRTEYLVIVTADGDLAYAEFGWTKNEGVQRFDWDGAEQRFRPLVGSVRQKIGPLDPTLNVSRVSVAAPTDPSLPYRLVVGSVGVGTDLTVTLVANDTAFGAPSPGSVEISKTTGNINWNATDLSTNLVGQSVFYQRQQFYTSKESKGNIGVAGTDQIMLNPIPGTGQKPLLRFGFGLWLTPVEVPDALSFSVNPVRGTFEWVRDVGLVKFNSVDLANNLGKNVYYDGVLFALGLTLPRQSLGTVQVPSQISNLPAKGGDLIFRSVLQSTLPTGNAVLSDPSTVTDSFTDFGALGVSIGDVVLLTSGSNAGHRRAITSVAGSTLTVAPPFPYGVGGSYQIDQGYNQYAEFVRIPNLSFDLFGSFGQVQISEVNGQVQFSFLDRALYGSHNAEVIFGDLLLERGVSFRFFRTPVDPTAQQTGVKDVSAVFQASNAVLADPIIGAPFVFLPVAPIDDASYPMTFNIQQGTGTFTGPLQRLDVPSPPDGYGYTINFEQKQLHYAIRKSNQVVPIPVPVPSVSLPDPLVDESNIVLEIDSGTGYVPLTLGQDVILDAASGVVNFTKVEGGSQVTGSAGSIFVGNLSALVDGGVNFLTSGVLVGDYLLIYTGGAKGVYTVTSVNSTSLGFQPPASGAFTNLAYEVRRGKEVIADRYFQQLTFIDPDTKVEKIRSLGIVANSPRLSIPLAYLGKSRFRFGETTFSTTVTQVANDGLFTNPNTLGQGAVEISTATGNLNFSQADVTSGVKVFWVRRLTQQVDYKIEPHRGLVKFTDRLFGSDEALITYSTAPDPTQPAPTTLPVNQERLSFLILKELLTHPNPASVLPFNPDGRTVATNPAPQVYRGGRPQQESVQVHTNPAASTVTFLPDNLVTNVLPHGAIVAPSERIYVDYYVYQAVGGEDTSTVLLPPINFATVVITEGTNSFTVKGDQTSVVPANYLLRIEKDEAYIIGGSTYDSSTNLTTVTLMSPQVFRNSYTQPNLYVTSGPIRISGTLTFPSYFVLETSPYDPIPRGMNRFQVQGDKSQVYVTGTVVYFTGGSPVVHNFHLVTGSKYNSTTDRTEITLTQTTAVQYDPGTYVLRRSVRPLLEDSASSVRTSTSPVLAKSYTVFRQVEGSPGVILNAPVDYQIDDSGKIDFTPPLTPLEEISIFYTRYRVVAPGNLRASYTADVSPSDANGFVNQVLSSDYYTLSPDSFFCRVESLTNFRAEVSKNYRDDASSSAPSGGPRISNTSQQKLYQQGQASVFYEEGYLANEDLVARATLKFYHDLINYLEDVLKNMDGRIVGDYDGRFKFDGTTGTQVTSISAANNQIDDSIEISPFPIDFTPPLLPFKFLGTFLKAYEPSASSRMYPTEHVTFNYTIDGYPSAKTRKSILDLKSKKLTGIFPLLFRRIPRAKVTQDVRLGSAILQVDTTGAVSTLPGPFRPAFQPGMQVVVQDVSGFFYISQLTPATILTVNPTSLVLSAPTLFPIPAGASVYLADSDTTFQKFYRMFFDVGVHMEKGEITYIKPYPPFDGSIPAIPAELNIQPPSPQELLETIVTFTNTETEPVKFPALYGQPLDDNGDQRLPLINPSYIRESGANGPSYLDSELTLIGSSGLIVGFSHTPFIGTGDLDATKTVITNSTPFTMPLPQKWDLVRILSGTNGATQFHRIIAVTANTVTVDVPFNTQDTGFQYTITTGNNLVPAATTATITLNVLVDPFEDFLAADIQPGHTVVFTQTGSPSEGERRQVVSVDSSTQLTLSSPFSTPLLVGFYRVYNPFSTYGGITGVTSIVSGEKAILSTNSDSELSSIDAFYELAFTDRLNPATSSGVVSGTTLTDTGVNFVSAGVSVGDYVYVTPSQGSSGIYLVQKVVSATVLQIRSPSFPVAGTYTYRVVKAFGPSTKTLQDLFVIRTAIDAFYQSTVSWEAFVNANLPLGVLVPPGVVDAATFAHGIMPSDLASREAVITARKTDLDDPTGPIITISTIMSSGDRLYDKRYTWIDARTNLEDGILPKASRAVAQRIKNQKKTLKQLIKLLATEN